MLKMSAAAAATVLAMAAPSFGQTAAVSVGSQPLVIGETVTIQSRALGETRRINVYTPQAYSDSSNPRLPVLYMPDGGIAEDFLHIAGLIQISAANGTMRPFILVGIENTQRRRDMTGPTDDPEDRKIAPAVGGSAAFRRFIRTELIPAIESRYRTTEERAIIGESLAGLFVVETFLLEPDLFDTYIAFDPSLWWNRGALVAAPQSGAARTAHPNTLYLAASSEEELATLTKRFAETLRARSGVSLHHDTLPDETHGTIYHPAALRAFRMLFKPAPEK
jgi:uncharacterized protein